MFLGIFFTICVFCALSPMLNARHFASVPNRRCMPSFEVQWTRELGTSPIAAPPLITDIDGDGNLDIIATTYAGDIHVVRAVDGTPLSGTKWPYRLLQSTVHATPIQHDYNGDGLLDILVVTSQGEIHIVSWDGTFITKYQLDDLYVRKDWYEQIVSVEEDNIHEFILDGTTTDRRYVGVDVHVLSTPALVDLDRDGVTEELIIPVSYYYDLDYYSNPELFAELQNNLNYTDLQYYLASALVILNVTSLIPIRTIHMELTKVTAEYPGYQLFSPTVIDIDSDGSTLEIVCGTSAGHLHVFNADGTDREGFPVPTESLQGQITVEDVTQDGRLDLITMDTSGNVACYSTSGDLQWETVTSGSRPSGTRVASLHGDDKVQVILAADDGFVWVLDGHTGNVIQEWPFKISGQLISVPLVTKVQSLAKPVIMVLDSKGYLQILGQDRCRRALTLRESSLAPVVSHDLIPTSHGLEYLVATDDGMLMCIGQTNQTGMLQEETEDEDIRLYAWPSEVKSTNNFAFAKYGLAVELQDDMDQIMSSTFSIAVTIFDIYSGKPTQHGYTIQVHIGSVHLLSTPIQTPNTVHYLEVPSPDHVIKGHLVITCTDRNGRAAQQILPISFYQSLKTDLQWLLIAPTIAMGLIPLFLYGFPSEVLLPSFYNPKDR